MQVSWLHAEPCGPLFASSSLEYANYCWYYTVVHISAEPSSCVKQNHDLFTGGEVGLAMYDSTCE